MDRRAQKKLLYIAAGNEKSVGDILLRQVLSMSASGWTANEICRMYRQAKNQKAEIKILAELTDCRTSDIKLLLELCGQQEREKIPLEEAIKNAKKSISKTSPWTAEVLEKVVILYREGMTCAAISRKLGLPQDSLRTKIWQMKRKNLI